MGETDVSRITYGFGEYRETAIDLLRETINILNENRIMYCLISGTLLGQVRHNDFIPWDDDIDLLVSDEIFDILPDIREKYSYLHFICADYMTFVKVSFKERGHRVRSQKGLKFDHCKDELVHNRWPFADLYVYSQEGESLKFFHKLWDKDKFFPLRNVSFLGMDACVPADPDYFLSINFGPKYMTEFIKQHFIHKAEKSMTARCKYL